MKYDIAMMIQCILLGLLVLLAEGGRVGWFFTDQTILCMHDHVI